MTAKEAAQKIIDQKGSCRDILCRDCSIHKGCDTLLKAGAEDIDFREPSPAHVELAREYLLEAKYA